MIVTTFFDFCMYLPFYRTQIPTILNYNNSVVMIGYTIRLTCVNGSFRVTTKVCLFYLEVLWGFISLLRTFILISIF